MHGEMGRGKTLTGGAGRKTCPRRIDFQEEADQIKAKLEAAGAKVEVK